MGALLEIISSEEKRPQLVDDCVSLVDSEVESKKGLSGKMVKMGYKAFVSIKPGIVKRAVDFLLDDFAGVLDGYHEEYLGEQPERKTPFSTWVLSREKRIAEDLLEITDGIIDQSDKKVIKKIYSGLRGVAAKHVAEAVPNVGRLVEKHAG
ncbi:MAG: hypothetical protein R6V85_14785 [Polyangia bacterium]